jgi:hypothetical protein
MMQQTMAGLLTTPLDKIYDTLFKEFPKAPEMEDKPVR